MTTVALRRELAGKLGSLFGQDAQIRKFVDDRTNLQPEEVAWLGAPGLTWDYVLAKLLERRDYAALTSALQGGRAKARNVDWNKYTSLTAPPSESEIANGHAMTLWSQLDLDVRWDHEPDASAKDARASAHLATGQELLHARVTMRWEGERPADPTFMVDRGRNDGPAPVCNLAPSSPDGFETWTSVIPVRPLSWRTRKVTVKCSQSGPGRRSARRLLVARSGSYIAAAVWIAFAILAWRRLDSLAPGWLTYLATFVGIGSGAVATFVLGLLAARNLQPWLHGAFGIWERALGVTVLGTAAIAVLPILFCVQVTNQSGRPVELANGPALTATAEAVAVWRLDKTLEPVNKTAFCVGRACTSSCVHQGGSWGVTQLVVCLAETRRKTVRKAGSDQYAIDQPLAGDFHELAFPAGTIGGGVRITWGSDAYLRVDHTPADRYNAVPVRLPVPGLPAEQVFAIAFNQEGVVGGCSSDATDIASVEVDTTPASAAFLTLGGSSEVPRHTTWNAERAMTVPLRGCSKAVHQLTVEIDDKAKFPNKLKFQSPTIDVAINDIALKHCHGRAYHSVTLSYSGPRHPFRDPQSPVSVVNDTLGIACDDPIVRGSQKIALDREECTYGPLTLVCKHAVVAATPKVVSCYLSDAGVIEKGCPCQKDIALTSDRDRKATQLNSIAAARLGCTDLCRCP